jgi:hypothetical protein
MEGRADTQATEQARLAVMTLGAQAAEGIILENIADAIVQDGLASQQELDALIHALYAFAADPRTVAGLARVIQAWGRRPVSEGTPSKTDKYQEPGARWANQEPMCGMWFLVRGPWFSTPACRATRSPRCRSIPVRHSGATLIVRR